AEFARPEDARGDEVEDVLPPLADDGVPGVVAALGSYDDVGLLGEEIDDLAFAFVAPLGADHDGVGHGRESENSGSAAAFRRSGRELGGRPRKERGVIRVTPLSSAPRGPPRR